MREIKFRAWDDLYKKMYGYNSAWKLQWSDGRMWDINLAEYLDHIILMQYTGLKDSNGKEIYEGDIVFWPHMGETELYEVYYNEDEVHYFARPINNLGETESYLDSTHMQIIGNIYENPELLK